MIPWHYANSHLICLIFSRSLRLRADTKSRNFLSLHHSDLSVVLFAEMLCCAEKMIDDISKIVFFIQHFFIISEHILLIEE
jgi:hypothetical protein